MTIAEWGSIGELLGSLGVLVTLVFLVAQMRQNTLAIKSASLEGVLSGYAALNREWFGTSARSAENRAVWKRGHERFDSLDDDEKSLFHHMMLDYVFHLQNVMQLRDRGLAEAVDFEAWDVHVVGTVATSGGLVWWETMGATLPTRFAYTSTVNSQNWGTRCTRADLETRTSGSRALLGSGTAARRVRARNRSPVEMRGGESRE